MAFAGIGFRSPMQLPDPTLIVNEGTTVTVTLTNKLPKERNGIHGHEGTEVVAICLTLQFPWRLSLMSA